MKNPNAQVLGKLGGEATKKKYGKEHYQRLAENMNKKRWGEKPISQSIKEKNEPTK